MLCEKCGKNTATTHFKSYVNGKVTEMHLCGQCANEEGINNFPLFNAFSSIFGAMPALKTEKRCPCCGSSFNEIAETGFVGCSECYNTFNEEILPSLKMMHGATKHSVINKKPDELTELRQNLKKAIKEERFEDAARLRDEIKKKEGKQE